MKHIKNIKYFLIPKVEKEFKGNIWSFLNKANAICITINLHIKNNDLIMGAGIAKEAKDRYPGIEKNAAWIYDNFGFDIHTLKTHLDKNTKLINTHILGFPTKPNWIRVKQDYSNILPYYRNYNFVVSGKDIPGYMGYSDLSLIEKSAIKLKNLIETMGWNMVICPKVGCGYGGLEWKNVKTILINVGLYHMDEIFFIEKD
jgi:hypothetical protein